MSWVTATCPRCRLRLLDVEMDGNKILAACCMHPECSMWSVDDLTPEESYDLSADIMGSICDAAMDRMEER